MPQRADHSNFGEKRIYYKLGLCPGKTTQRCLEAQLPDLSEFDPHTPLAARTLDELWLPYADRDERQMRDMVFGPNQAAYEQSLKPCRVNRHITHTQLENVYDAVLFANELGSVLNVEITVTWRYAIILDYNEIEINYKKFSDRLRKFLEYHNCPVHYYAIFENGPSEGYHTHFAAHIPDRIRPEFKSWRRRAARDWAVALDVSARFLHVHMHRDDNVAAQWNLFKYLMKGLNPKLSRLQKRVMPKADTANYYYGVQKREAGAIMLNRVRIARALGPLARSKLPFYDRPHAIDGVSFADRYSDLVFRRRGVVRALQAMVLI